MADVCGHDSGPTGLKDQEQVGGDRKQSPVSKAAAGAAYARIRANRDLLAMLTAFWEHVPDWRFGQLVMNLSRTEDGFADTWEWNHGQWRERIQKLYNEVAWPVEDALTSVPAPQATPRKEDSHE